MSGTLSDKIILPQVPSTNDDENVQKPVKIVTHSPIYDSSKILYSHLKWIDYDKMEKIYKEAIRNKFIDSAIRKLWTAICPSYIDIILKQDGIMYQPSERFSDTINSIWSMQMQKALRSIMIVGYYLVTFCSKTKSGNTVPNVVDPIHYRLWWEYDYNGRRKYGAIPLGLPIDPDRDSTVETGHNLGYNVYASMPEFDDYKLFVYDEPTDDGQITSRTRCVLTDITCVQQIINDWMIGLNQRTNNPIVIQSVSHHESPSGRAATGLGPGGMAVDNQAAVAIRMSQGLDTRLPPSLSRNVAEADISLNLMRYSASQYAQNRITNDQLGKQVQMFNDTASLAPSRLFDDRRGVMTTGAAMLPWQRGLTLKVPPHLEIAKQLDTPEPPRSMPNVVNLLISLISSELGVPQETILQVIEKDPKMKTADLNNADFERSVKWWRNNFSHDMTKLYWRIYGEDHVDQPVFDILPAKTAKKATINGRSKKKYKQPHDVSIMFSFRLGKLTSAIAEKYYSMNILKYSAVIETLSTEYGIPREMINSVGPNETQSLVDDQRKMRSTNDFLETTNHGLPSPPIVASKRAFAYRQFIPYDHSLD